METPNNPDEPRYVTFEEHQARSEAALNLIGTMVSTDIVEFYLHQALAEDSALWNPLCSAFEKLAETNPTKMLDVYIGLAQREDSKERWFGAFHIIHLTPLDHDLGMYFWEKFMGDPDPEVREFAYNMLEENVPDNPRQQDYESFRDLGITWRDACNLYRAYIHPQQRGVYADLGDAALGRTAEVPGQ